jgi:hypothetical protein
MQAAIPVMGLWGAGRQIEEREREPVASYEFMRGRQMIVHDRRLNNPFTNPPSPLNPPMAFNVWSVGGNDSAEAILDWVASVAGGNSGVAQLDALYFMAHGYPGGIQLGRDNLSWSNVKLFEKLDSFVRCIVFFSCQVGAEQSYHNSSYELTFGNAVATYAQCRVIACKANQLYSWSGGVIDFGEFEGTVYVYEPGGHGARILNYSSSSDVSLEGLVFSS